MSTATLDPLLGDPLISRKLGDYTIVELLGQGGMARVYRGYDAHLDRYAAVKVIKADLGQAEMEEYRQRFMREARAIARLQHPNIVGVYQFAHKDDRVFMAMHFVEGRDLREILKESTRQNRRMPQEQILRIVRDVASALDYAHANGVIHRDIKPSNIMITPEGRAILTDFGLALHVSEGTMGLTFGTAHYIAPEQALSSADAVPQSDLYSLGVVLFEMLTGKVPFDDPAAMSVALKHLNEPPPPPSLYNPDLPPLLDQMVLHALEKDPTSRYPSGKAMARALELALNIQERNAEIARDFGTDHLPPLQSAVRAAETAPAQGRAAPSIFEIDTDSYPAVRAETAEQRPSETILLTRQAQGSPQDALPAMIFRGRTWTGAVGRRLLLGLALGMAVLLVVLLAVIGLTGGGRLPESAAAGDAPGELVVNAMTRPASYVPAQQATQLDAQPAGEDAATLPSTEAPSSDFAATAQAAADSAAPVPLDAAAVLAQAEVRPAVWLIYNDESLLLVNLTGRQLDISSWTFERLDSEHSQPIRFEADSWDRAGGASPSSALAAGECFQVWRSDLGERSQPFDTALCATRAAFWTTTAAHWFWRTDGGGGTFTVMIQFDECLATCDIAAGYCEITLEH